MTGTKLLFSLLFASAALTVFPAGAAPPPGGVVVGVDIPTVDRLSVADQDKLLSDLHANGVRAIRTWISNDGSYEFVKKAFALGIKCDLSVVFKWRPDAPKRATSPDVPDIYAGPGLSGVDAEATGANFQTQLNKLESMGIDFVSFEVGNEQNNPHFNGDFQIRPKNTPKKSKLMTMADLKQDPEAQQLAAGFQNYVKLLAAVKQVRDHSKLNQRTPVILGGLADQGQEGAEWPTSRVSGVGIAAIIGYMRQNGLDNAVDFYGIHTYPWTNGPGQPGPAADRLKRLEANALSVCKAPGQGPGKPCWVTEWGLDTKIATCPINDEPRAVLAKELMGDFRTYVKQRRVQGLLYFVWEKDPWAKTEEPYSIYRCGSLTASGRVAIDASLLQ